MKTSAQVRREDFLQIKFSNRFPFAALALSYDFQGVNVRNFPDVINFSVLLRISKVMSV